MQTKKNMIDIYHQIGIQKGSIVCLQVNMNAIHSILGQAQTCIESLMEVVTNSGCIIVPTFDTSSLDPSCLDGIDYEKWKPLRKEEPGYRRRLTGCDAFGIQFLRNPKVRRSKHPSYSFAYWGNYDESRLEAKPDFPVSFNQALWPMQNENAMNVLIGYDETKSVLPYVIAKKQNIGTWMVQRAKVGMSDPPVFETFMSLSLEKKEQAKCLEACSIHRYMFDDVAYTCLHLDNSSVK